MAKLRFMKWRMQDLPHYLLAFFIPHFLCLHYDRLTELIEKKIQLEGKHALEILMN